MRIGIFSTCDAYPGVDPERHERRLEELLDLARVAERIGYSSFWVTEHHFQPSGALASPPVWLAAAARETRRIRLGSLVAALPLHDPRELAEQYALVDRLSQGRLDIGVGTGYLPMEFHGFGRDPTTRQERFREALPEFLRALSGDSLSAPGAPGGRVALNVLPVQRPHPPVWIAAGRTEAIRSIGERGERLALIPYATLSNLSGLAERVQLYHASLPSEGAGRVLAGFHVYAGERTEAAEVALQRFLDTRLAPESPAFRARLTREPELATAQGLRERGLALLGGEHELSERLAAISNAGVTDLAAIVDFGGLPFDEVVRSMERFLAIAQAVEGPVRVADVRLPPGGASVFP